MMRRPDYSKLYKYDAKRKLYHKTLTVQMPDGTKSRKRLTARDPEELHRKIQAWERDGGAVSYPTLGKLLDDWLGAKESELRPGTLRSYDPACKLWAPLHSTRIDRITAEMVQARLQQLHAEGYAGKTIKTALSCLRLAYDWAIPTYHGALSNPADRAVLPRHMRATKRSAPDEAVTQLIINARDDYWGMYYYTLLYTGLRRGELLGLTWGDVDLEAGEIHVDKQLIYVHGKPTIGPLKTESSIRTVPILPALQEALIAMRPPGVSGDSYIYGSPTDPAQPMPEAALKRREMHYCKQHGLVTTTTEERTSKTGRHYTVTHYRKTLTPHMIRHATATLCYEAGVDAMTAAALLGHSDPRITQSIYTDLRQQHAARQINKLADYMATAYGGNTHDDSDND